jgi:hypothetical protein
MVPVGVDGYLQEGVLGFCKGSYYAKLTGYASDETIEGVLTDRAEELASLIQGSNELPLPFAWFPDHGRIPRSEQYVSRDFLGHSFLTSVYVAEYASDTGKFRAFIVETESPAGAEDIVREYRAVANAVGGGTTSSEPIRIVDPYHESAGVLYLQQRGSYVFGAFSDDPSVFGPLLKAIDESIASEE